MITVLFVCTGNTCRSPMAAALFQRECERLALPVAVKSAGLAATARQGASRGAREAMAEVGLDVEGHKATPLTQALLGEAGLIVAMTPEHVRALIGMEVSADKIAAMEGGVSDPYGGDVARYRACREEIEGKLPPILERVRALLREQPGE